MIAKHLPVPKISLVMKVDCWGPWIAKNLAVPMIGFGRSMGIDQKKSLGMVMTWIAGAH